MSSSLFAVIGRLQTLAPIAGETAVLLPVMETFGKFNSELSSELVFN